MHNNGTAGLRTRELSSTSTVQVRSSAFSMMDQINPFSGQGQEAFEALCDGCYRSNSVMLAGSMMPECVECARDRRGARPQGRRPPHQPEWAAESAVFLFAPS